MIEIRTPGFMAALGLCLPLTCAANGMSDTDFRSHVELQAFGAHQELVEDSSINPGNTLGVPETLFRADLRPDLHFNFQRVTLDFKPRAWASHFEVTDAGGEESDSDSDALVNEWLLRVRATDRFFVSVGRENLQWGPSLLLSPSNPFNADNNRNNPSSEVPGLDYARVVVVPSSAWSASLIANVGEGALEIDDHQDKYALKFDYTGNEKYFSLIPSVIEDDDDNVNGLGFYASVSPSEGLTLYTEGMISDSDAHSSILVGGSYTFLNTSVLTFELYSRDEGCIEDSFAACAGLGFDPMAGSVGLSDALIREQYVLTQFYRDWSSFDTSFVMRWIHGLDDSSDRIIFIVEHELSNRFEIFGIANFTNGGSDTEFGSLVDYSAQIGINFTF